MSQIEESIIGLADEVAMNPDVVTINTRINAENIVNHIDEIEDRNAIESMIYEISLNGKWQQRIYLLSVLIHYSKNNRYIIEMLQYVLEYFDDISLTTLSFIRQQVADILFLYPSVVCQEIDVLLWQLYDGIMDKYASFFSELIEEPINNVNKDLVLVFTEQMLEKGHGPTKSALDRCKTLMTRMNKKVVLINTAESDTTGGLVPFYGTRVANYKDDLSNVEEIEWKGVKVPFVQFANTMPDSISIRNMTMILKNLKPSYGISINGGEVMVSLFSKMMPMLTVGMVPSSIIPTSGWCQTYSKEITQNDEEMLNAVGRDKNHIIKAVFGSSILDIQEKKTKEMLGFKELDFVIVLVGGRIKIEADNTFWKMLNECGVSNFKLIILGNTQDEIRPNINGFENLQDRVYALGMQDDPLGYMCAADIYVNPKRRGGGTSCVEAMSLGIPVVTLDYGDVAVNVGSDFHVQSYEEMQKVIERYATDKEFYESQSKKAQARAERLLNAEDDFVEVVNEFLRRAANNR